MSCPRWEQRIALTLPGAAATAARGNKKRSVHYCGCCDLFELLLLHLQSLPRYKPELYALRSKERPSV